MFIFCLYFKGKDKKQKTTSSCFASVMIGFHVRPSGLIVQTQVGHSVPLFKVLLFTGKLWEENKICISLFFWCSNM